MQTWGAVSSLSDWCEPSLHTHRNIANQRRLHAESERRNKGRVKQNSKEALCVRTMRKAFYTPMQESQNRGLLHNQTERVFVEAICVVGASV